MVLDPVNMLAESFIFHGEDEIEFLVTINWCWPEWFNDTMFRKLIKLNKYSNEVICSTFELMLIMIMSVNFVESSCWER